MVKERKMVSLTRIKALLVAIMRTKTWHGSHPTSFKRGQNLVVFMHAMRIMIYNLFELQNGDPS